MSNDEALLALYAFCSSTVWLHTQPLHLADNLILRNYSTGVCHMPPQLVCTHKVGTLQPTWTHDNA